MKANHVKLNGVKTYAFSSKKDLIDYVSDKKKILIAVNAEKILCAGHLRELINSNVGYTDGFGAVLAMKLHLIKGAIKIPGCELWLDIIRTLYRERSFYLVGSKPDVINKTIEKLLLEFPGINILNYRDGYLKSKEEKQELILDIKTKRPDVVFVATGSPNQELLMEEMYSHHQALYMGLGGSFDVYIGAAKRAPKFYIKYRLEWMYRLLKDPLRIKRQIHLVRFGYLLFRGAI